MQSEKLLSLSRNVHVLWKNVKKNNNCTFRKSFHLTKYYSKFNLIPEHNMHKPIRISVEGNISSGKSTLINYFKQYSNIDTYTEPIDNWRDVKGINLLDLKYSDMKRWNHLFQSYVQLTRLKTQLKPPTHPGVTVQLIERSLQNNRFCFVEQAHKHGLLSDPEYAVIVSWYETLEEIIDIKVDLIVYLRSDPNTCFERMQSRARPEEKPISLEYLRQLHEAHEEWLITSDENAGAPVIILDAEKNKEEIIKEYEKISDYVLGKKLYSSIN